MVFDSWTKHIIQHCSCLMRKRTVECLVRDCWQKESVPRTCLPIKCVSWGVFVYAMSWAWLVVMWCYGSLSDWMCRNKFSSDKPRPHWFGISKWQRIPVKCTRFGPCSSSSTAYGIATTNSFGFILWFLLLLQLL